MHWARERKLIAITATCILAAAGGCASLPQETNLDDVRRATTRASIPADTVWSIRSRPEGTVIFRSAQNVHAASAQHNAFLYPAPNAVGLLAAIATHAFIVSSVMERQRDSIRAAADKRLEPYQAVLEQFENSQLLGEALARFSRQTALRIDATGAERPWGIDVSPVFTLSESGETLILDSAIKYYGPESKSDPFNQLMVRVVSDPKRISNPVTHWTENHGANLRAESASLLAESIRIAIENAQEVPALARSERTFRYLEGEEEKTERAALVNAGCHRIVIKNLRGWLMSVPPSAQSLGPECVDPGSAAN